MAPVDYAEAPASPWLRPYVRRYWSLTDTAPRADRGPERVVPDGRMEVIVHLGDPFTRRAAAPASGPQPRALLAGQLLGPLLLQPGSRVDLFAIRFEAWGAHALLGVEPAALLERLPALDDVLGADAGRLADMLARAPGFRARVDAAERWCSQRLARATRPPAAVVAAARAATAKPALRTVSELAAHVGWSPRRLERGFAAHLGLAPKVLLRIARVQRLIGRLTEPRAQPPLAALALDAGFADQAHMTREFTRLAGVSPARYRAEAHGLQDAILDPTA